MKPSVVISVQEMNSEWLQWWVPARFCSIQFHAVSTWNLPGDKGRELSGVAETFVFQTATAEEKIISNRN